MPKVTIGHSHSPYIPVLATCRFYLDYVLPRSDDWKGVPLEVAFVDVPSKQHTARNLKVLVVPMDDNGNLFPEAIDRTMSTMRLDMRRLSNPTGGGISIRVMDRVLDRIDALVSAEVPSDPAQWPSDAQVEILEAACRACNRLLVHCRTIARSTRLTGIIRKYRIQDNSYYLTSPHTLTWHHATTGEALRLSKTPDGFAHAAAGCGAMESPECGLAPMSAVLDSLRTDIEPDLSQSLLVDGQMHLEGLRLRESILSFTTALEVGVNVYSRNSGRNQQAEVRRVSGMRGLSFAQRNLHELTLALSRRSLQSEDGTLFGELERLYRIRNNVAHEGRCFYMDGGNEIAVSPQECVHFLAATRRALIWLDSL